MARYYTDTEELTSIADAIRAKTGGSSSLVYPTGFVSEIDNLSLYNYAGENAELVWQSSDINFTLADTTLSSWTPSTSATTIYNTTNYGSEAISLDGTKHYTQIQEIYYNINYTEVPSGAHIEEGYAITFCHFGRRPNSYTNFINDNYNWIIYTLMSALQNQIMINSSGGRTVTQNTNGFYVNGGAPNFNNQSKAQFDYIPRTPTIRAVAASGYMETSSFPLIDLNNSDFHIKIKVYSCDNNLMLSTSRRIKELYNINHNIT